MNSPSPSRFRRVARGLAGGLGGLVLLWLAGWFVFLLDITAATPQEPDARTDAIIVLTGGQNRINTGLDLLAAGEAKYLFISGVNPNVTIQHLIKLWKPDFHDVPPCCILLGVKAGDTEGNARESSDWVREQGVDSIRLVTSNYHLPRALLEFHHALPRHKIIPHPIRPISTDSDSGHFMTLSFGEYNKTLLTWLRLYIYPWSYRGEAQK